MVMITSAAFSAESRERFRIGGRELYPALAQSLDHDRVDLSGRL